MWKFRFIPVWQEGKELSLLKSMSADGWHLRRVVLFCYEFEKAEPRDYEYALDFIIEARTDMADYRRLIEESGWQHVAQMSGWHYFPH